LVIDISDICREVTMLTKIQKWGNSPGLRLSKSILAEAQLELGDEVTVSVKGRRIVVEPVPSPRRRHDLKELVSRIPKDYRAEEVDWGRAIGKEAW
jgi:antitoxin MazE